MKKFLLIPALFITLFIMGCGQPAPQKIEGLVVPDCNRLATDLKVSNPKATDDEIYKSASDILYSDERAEEALACCGNIIDQKVRGECEKKGEK